MHTVLRPNKTHLPNTQYPWLDEDSLAYVENATGTSQRATATFRVVGGVLRLPQTKS